MRLTTSLLTLLLGSLSLPLLAATSVSRVDADHYQHIRCGQLLDVINEKTLENQDILVRGSVIEAIGPALAVPAGATRIDLSDRVCMPGLMDMHLSLIHI